MIRVFVLAAGLAVGLRADPLVPTFKEPGWEAGSSVLERWQKAQGLDRPAAGVFPRLAVVEVIAGDAPSGFTARLVTTAGAYRVAIETPQGKRYGEISTGADYWHVSNELGVGRLPHASDIVESMRRYRPDPAALRRRYTRWVRLPDQQRDGKTRQVVVMQTKEGAREYWWFDPDTGALVIIDAMSVSNEVLGRVRFSDFRTVDGVVEPFAMVDGEGPRRTTVRVREVTNRVQVPPRFFELPPEEMTRWQKSQEVLLNYIKASGGVLALAQIVSRVTKSVGEDMNSGSKFELTLTEKSPVEFLVERFDPGIGRSWRGFDGETGWELSELQGFRALRGGEVELLRRNGQLNTENFTTLFPLRQLVGPREVNGRKTVAIALATLNGKAGVHYFDVATGQLLRVESQLVGPDANVPVTFDFSDFRVVDGVTLPFQIMMSNPAFKSVTRVQSVEHNVKLAPDFFQPRKLD